MPYYYKNKKDTTGWYNMDSIGTDISLDLVNSKNPDVQVYSDIGDSDNWTNETQSAVAHGVLLTLTALATEGMHKVLNDPKFEHCIKCALDRVPSLSNTLESGE